MTAADAQESSCRRLQGALVAGQGVRTAMRRWEQKVAAWLWWGGVPSVGFLGCVCVG